jgi:hypothetical protein
MFHATTKHIEAKHHFIRKQIHLGNVDLAHIPFEDQVANILIKALGWVKFQGSKINLALYFLITWKKKTGINWK